MRITEEYYELIARGRKSVRTNNFTVTAKIKREDGSSSDVDVSDISAGGLLFLSKEAFAKGEKILIDLTIEPIVLIRYNPLSIETQGEVLKVCDENTSHYAAVFKGMASSVEKELDILITKIFSKFVREDDSE